MHINMIKDDYIQEIRDNGGPQNNGTPDRYTVVYYTNFCATRGSSTNNVDILTMCSQPNDIQGYYERKAGKPGDHLGKLIEFEELPLECQDCVIDDLAEDFYQEDYPLL